MVVRTFGNNGRTYIYTWKGDASLQVIGESTIDSGNTAVAKVSGGCRYNVMLI